MHYRITLDLKNIVRPFHLHFWKMPMKSALQQVKYPLNFNTAEVCKLHVYEAYVYVLIEGTGWLPHISIYL